MAISSGNKILASDVNTHINDKNNPHGITPASIGAATSDHTHSEYVTKEYVDNLFAENSTTPTQDISLTFKGSYNCYRDYWDPVVSMTCSPSATDQVYALAQISLKAGNSNSFGTLDFAVPCGGSYKAENIKVCDSNGYGAYFDMTFSFTGSKLSIVCALKSKVTTNGSAEFGHITGTGRYIGKYI